MEKDFYNHKPAKQRGDGIDLHLVRHNGIIKWLTPYQIKIVLANPRVQVVTDGSAPTARLSLEFPRHKEKMGNEEEIIKIIKNNEMKRKVVLDLNQDWN